MTKDRLREIAGEAGFDAVGVTPAVRAPHAGAFLEWLGEGMHASMVWLARDPEKRCDPRLLVPGARSVIALGMNYFVPDTVESEGGAVRGKIARYARGRDYHHLIRKRLRRIDRELAAVGGTQRGFVDSGPLLERDFAVAAGIAWHGKSTLALHPKLGTWFFLAAVVTTLEFDPDPPLRDRCGTCTRCLDACPTGAIVAPHRVDARKCISYWTIEHEGDIPVAIREKMGDRIFGCDDCLDACPWNRFAAASREADFQARDVSTWPLRVYLELGEETFRKMFEGSPIRRTGWQGFLRNVCVALGNAGQLDDLPALEGRAGGTDAVVAEHARWAILRIRERQRGLAPGV